MVEKNDRPRELPISIPEIPKLLIDLADNGINEAFKAAKGAALKGAFSTLQKFGDLAIVSAVPAPFKKKKGLSDAECEVIRKAFTPINR
jgi:hypothetical protein